MSHRPAQPGRGGRPRWYDALCIALGVVFIPAGLVKFVFYDWELGHFERFGLPVPVAFVILAGVLETAGGVLLIARRHVRATAALLAATMVVAIAVSGIKEGDVIPSLTLAPLLLAGCLALLAARREDDARGHAANRERRPAGHPQAKG